MQRGSVSSHQCLAKRGRGQSCLRGGLRGRWQGDRRRGSGFRQRVLGLGQEEGRVTQGVRKSCPEGLAQWRSLGGLSSLPGEWRVAGVLQTRELGRELGDTEQGTWLFQRPG